MVSSTDTIRQAASEAAVSALMRTTAGSHTKASKLSAMSSLLMSTPYHMPPWKNRKEEVIGNCSQISSPISSTRLRVLGNLTLSLLACMSPRKMTSAWHHTENLDVHVFPPVPLTTPLSNPGHAAQTRALGPLLGNVL